MKVGGTDTVKTTHLELRMRAFFSVIEQHQTVLDQHGARLTALERGDNPRLTPKGIQTSIIRCPDKPKKKGK